MTAPTQAPPSRYALGSVPNMLRSLLVIGALVVGMVLLVPRPNAIEQPPFDVHAVAVDEAQRTHLPLLEAVGLPGSWKGTSARYVRSTDGVMAWHAGYLTPDAQSVAVEQAKNPTRAWVQAEVNRGLTLSPVTIDGVSYQRFDRPGKVQRSLVRPSGSPGGLTTVVTGTASWDQLSYFVQHLKPATS